MKKILLLVVLVLSATTVSSAGDDDPVTVLSDTGKIYNSIWKRYQETEVRIIVNPKNYDAMFAYTDFTGVVLMTLDGKSRESFRRHLSKFLEWNKTATTKKVRIDKEIGTIPDLLCVFQWVGGEYHRGTSSAKIAFESVTKTRHWMTVSISRIQSTKNQFISLQPTALSLEAAAVRKIRRAISEKSIRKKADAEVAKKRTVHDDFK